MATALVEVQLPDTIFAATQACLRGFKECLNVPLLKHREWVENRLADFDLWSAGVGASAKDKLSLDTRLMCDVGMRTVVIDLLNTLIVYVQQCRTLGLDVESQGGEAAAISLSPLLREAMDGTEDLLDQLANLAIIIRQAGTSSRLQKADRASNRTEHEDLGILLKVLLQARPERPANIKYNSLEDVESPRKDGNLIISAENFGVVTSPLDPVQDHFVRANIRRRNRFVYAQRHAKNLAAFNLKSTKLDEPVESLDRLDKGQPGAVTIERAVHQHIKETISTQEQPNAKDEAAQSIKSRDLTSKASTFGPTDEIKDPGATTASQQAMTQASHTALKVTIPRPRKIKKGLKIFKCPCCCQTLPYRFTERNQWTKHLGQDLCPYSCPIPFDECQKPNNLYKTKKSWLNHINGEHKAQQCWKCIVCDRDEAFLTVEAFSAHLSTHPNISRSTFSRLIEACSQNKLPDISCCPLCPWASEQVDAVDRDSLLDHVAEHMYSFSLLSLPWADHEKAQAVPEELVSRVKQWIDFVPWGMDGEGSEISEDTLDKAKARLESALTPHIQNTSSLYLAPDHDWFSWLWPSRHRKGLIKERPVKEDVRWLNWLDMSPTERQEMVQYAIQTAPNKRNKDNYFEENDYFSEASGDSGLLSIQAQMETVPESEASSEGRSAGLPSLEFSAEESFGLAVLHSPTQEHISSGHAFDIVAVHGLGEDSFSTWTDESSTKLWLEDFLPLSEHGKRARIMIFGYDASVFIKPVSMAQHQQTFDSAVKLLNAIQKSRKTSEERARPIMFIAHSLGGLVVMNALTYAYHRSSVYRDLFRSTQGIIFFGTPHQRSDKAVLLRYLRVLTSLLPLRFSADIEHLKICQDWSQGLSKTCASFSDIAAQIPIVMFYEMKKTNGMTIVEQPAAQIHTTAGKSVGLNANHFDMCKFSAITDEDYERVLRIIEAIVRGFDRNDEIEMERGFHKQGLVPPDARKDFDYDGTIDLDQESMVNSDDSKEAKSADEWMSQMKKIHTRTNPKLVGDRRIEILARDSRNELVVATLDSGAEENWISRKVVDRLKLDVKAGILREFALFHGRTLSSDETIETSWRLEGQIKSQGNIFRIAPPDAPFDVLFGRNLLSSGTVNFYSVDWKRIRIAVLDDGLDFNHPTFRKGGMVSRISQRQNFIEGEGSLWGGRYGTDIAALLIEIAPDAQLYGAKVREGSQIPDSYAIVKAIEWAISCGVDFITITCTLNHGDNAVRKAIQNAYAHGIFIFIAAAAVGQSSSMVSFLAGSPEVFAIYATDGLGNPWVGNSPVDQLSGYNFATLGVAVKPTGSDQKAPIPPLLEPYNGTYQSILPMASTSVRHTTFNTNPERLHIIKSDSFPPPGPVYIELDSSETLPSASEGIPSLLSSNEKISDEKMETKYRVTGTSWATAIATGVAAYILYFARVNGMTTRHYGALHTPDGMAEVLAACLTVNRAGLRYIIPWRLFQENRTNEQIVSTMEAVLTHRFNIRPELEGMDRSME